MIWVLSFLFSWGLGAFTLISSSPARYQKNPVVVRFIDQYCDNIDLNPDQLKVLVQDAVAQYWNSIATSRLRFVMGEKVSLGSGATLTEMVASIEENQIIIGCSNNTTLFTATNILAVGTMTTNTPAKGVVAINNISGAQFRRLSDLNQKAVMAHELGHAFGIGHSTHEYSLMYFSLSNAIKQEFPSQDDADAVTYLYPKKSKTLGLLGACGTVQDISQDDFWLNLILVVGLLMIFYFAVLFSLGKQVTKSRATLMR